MTDAYHDIVGRTIAGRYRVESLLGEGAMGVVLRAVHLETGGRVAIKLLHPAYAQGARAVERFQTEARNAAALHHANTIRVTDFGQDGGRLFLVMEFVEGVPLDTLVHRNGKLSWRRTVRIVSQVLSALWEAHELRIVHRDIKGANILVVDQPGNPDFVKVLDFGISRQTESTGHGTHGPIGTPYTMSPEQWLGQDVDGRADLYAVGCVMFEMLAGQPVFDGALHALSYKHVHQPPPSLASLVDEAVPAGLIALVDGLLAKAPDDRPASAREVLEVLGQVVGSQDSSPAHYGLGESLLPGLGAPSRALLDRTGAAARSADAAMDDTLAASDTIGAGDTLAGTDTMDGAARSGGATHPGAAIDTLPVSARTVEPEAPGQRETLRPIARKTSRVLVLAVAAGILFLAGAGALALMGRGEVASVGASTDPQGDKPGGSESTAASGKGRNATSQPAATQLPRAGEGTAPAVDRIACTSLPSQVAPPLHDCHETGFTPWCTVRGTYLACCKDGLVSVGTVDGACACPPAGAPPTLASDLGCPAGNPDGWQDAFAAQMQTVRDEVRACYATSLGHNPDVEGSVKVKFFVNPDGIAFDTQIKQSALADAELQQCVVRAVDGRTFPPHVDGTVKVKYPLDFQKD